MRTSATECVALHHAGRTSQAAPPDSILRMQSASVMPSATARSTLARHWKLLSLLPWRGSGQSASELCSALAANGYEVSKRQIERDLRELSSIFPLQCSNRSIPYGWRWADGAERSVPQPQRRELDTENGSNGHAQVVADEQLRRVALLGDTGHWRDQLDSRYRPRLSLRRLPLSGGFAATADDQLYNMKTAL